MPNTSTEALLCDKVIQYLTDSVPELKHVNLDLGQLDFESIMPGVKFPCCLIDITEVAFQQMQDGQHGTLQLRLKFGFDINSDTSGRSHDGIRETGLNYFDIVNKVYTKMQFYDADALLFNDFIRLRFSTEKRPDNIRIVNNDYKATYHDRSRETA